MHYKDGRKKKTFTSPYPKETVIVVDYLETNNGVHDDFGRLKSSVHESNDIIALFEHLWTSFVHRKQAFAIGFTRENRLNCIGWD